MTYIALASREYGKGRILISADRFAGYSTGHGPIPERMWLRVLRWIGQRNTYETVRMGVVETAKTNFEQRLSDIPYVTFDIITLQTIAKGNISQYDAIMFIGLPASVNDDVKDRIADYVVGGGGVIVEVPDRGLENINVISSIDNVYCSSSNPPTQNRAYWTVSGSVSDLYDQNAVVSVLTTLPITSFSSRWTILMTDQQATYAEEIENGDLSEIKIAGNAASEISVSFIGGFEKGVVELEEESSETVSSSSSESSSSSSSSAFEPAAWSVCSDLVAQWKMNENNGKSFVWDSSGNYSHMGDLRSGVSYIPTSTVSVSGKLNRAFLFNGINQYVEVPQGTSLNFSTGGVDDPFAVAFWMYPNDVVFQRTLLHKHKSWRVYLQNSRIYLELYDGASTLIIYTTATILPAAWQFIAISYDGANAQIYVNAQNRTDASVDTGYVSMGNAITKFYMGSNNTQTSMYDSVLDNVIVIRRDVTQIEIEGLYNMGVGTETCSGLYEYMSSTSSSSSSVDSSSSSSSSSVDSSSSSSSSSSSI